MLQKLRLNKEKLIIELLLLLEAQFVRSLLEAKSVRSGQITGKVTWSVVR